VLSPKAEWLPSSNSGNFKVILEQGNLAKFKVTTRRQIPKRYRLEALLGIMDPSWSDIKKILRRHEDMAENSRVSYNQIDSKVNKVDSKVIDHEQITLTLLQRVQVLEQERRGSRIKTRFWSGALTQRVEALEQECYQQSAVTLPQHSNSGSNLQQKTEQPSEDQKLRHRETDIAPMEIEDREPNQG
jgi:hypothetical protein